MLALHVLLVSRLVVHEGVRLVLLQIVHFGVLESIGIFILASFDQVPNYHAFVLDYAAIEVALHLFNILKAIGQ